MKISFVLFIFILFYFFILLYNTVLVLPYIDMNPPWVCMCSQSRIPHPPPSPCHPPGSSQCTSPKHPASNLDWRFVSYMILYMFQCHSPKSSQPPSPTESKRLFYTSVSLLLSHIQCYHYHLSKFHDLHFLNVEF